jgi:GGDEF domain-containing protein
MQVSLVRLDAHNLDDDRVGHLAKLASELPDAIVSRIGDCAFAVELRGKGAWEAFELAQELQSDLASSTPPIWVTAGVAEAAEGEDRAVLLHRADVAVAAARVSRRSALAYSPELELPAAVSGA